MDDVYFLIPDAHFDGVHQLLHGLHCLNVNAQVFLFIRDFEKLKNLRDEFPEIVFILLDWMKNVDINKGYLRLLPKTIDCYLNFSGESFTSILTQIDEVHLSRDCTIPQEFLNLEGIAKELRKSETPGSVLINIKAEGSTKATPSCSIFTGEKSEPYGPPSKTPVKFQIGPKVSKKPVSFGHERQPLLSKSSSQQEPEPGFFRCLFCFCYACCSEQDSGNTVFESPDQLVHYIRMEHTAEMRQSLEKLFEKSDSDWKRVVKQLEDKERDKIEELVEKIQIKKRQEESQLNKEKDAQNKFTETNLSEVLPGNTIQKIKDSRDRSAKRKVKHDTEQSYQDGSLLIKRAAEMERTMLKDEHYSKTLLKQFEILTGIHEKYKRKQDRLHAKNFGKVKMA